MVIVLFAFMICFFCVAVLLGALKLTPKEEWREIPMETNTSCVDKEHMYLSSDEIKMINRIHKLHDEHPDEVRIIAEPENNDGCIYCVVPANWLRISPPKKMEFSDEQRTQLAERMKKLRQSSKNGGNDDEVRDRQ